MAIAVHRKGEEITLRPHGQGSDLSEPMDWIRAGALAASLAAHSDQARRREFRREHRCVDCGAQLEPGRAGDTCGEDCPSEAVA